MKDQATFETAQEKLRAAQRKRGRLVLRMDEETGRMRAVIFRPSRAKPEGEPRHQHGKLDEAKMNAYWDKVKLSPEAYAEEWTNRHRFDFDHSAVYYSRTGRRKPEAGG